MRQTHIPRELKLITSYSELVNSIKNIASKSEFNSIKIFTGAFALEKISNRLQEDLQSICDDIDLEILHEDLYHKITQRNFNPQEKLWVLGIGGGKVLDFAKYYATKCQANFISIPTLISHDGICSPVAVINGKSLAAKMPEALLVPLYIIEKNPLEQIQAGIGDLVANLSAIEDWRLAAEHRDEEIDDFAIMIAKRAALNIIQYLELEVLKHGNKDISEEKQEAILRAPQFLSSLIESLSLSGIAMSISGNSRPCSGAEHLISHAIDELHGHGNKASHGIQVLIASIYLQKIRTYDILDASNLDSEKEQETKLEKIFKALNFPISFTDINIKFEELELILEKAPSTRKDRFTILDLCTRTEPQTPDSK